MQIFIVLGILLGLTIFGSSQWSRYGVSSTESIKISSDGYAGNLYMYNDYALQYIYQNYSTIINNPLNIYNNKIAYLRQNNFDINNLTQFYSKYINFKEYNKYKSSYFLYSKSNGSGSDIPQVYLITSFDSSDDFKVRNMFGSYNNFITAKDNPGDTNYWTNVIFGINNGIGNDPIILSTLPTGVVSNVIPFLKNNVFTNLQNNGYSVGKYFIIIPVFMNN